MTSKFVEIGHISWIEVSKCDPRAKEIAVRHYSFRPVKSRKMGGEVGPPGQKIVMLTRNEKALWGSHRPAPWSGIRRMDGFNGPCCFIFRNEGSDILSSTLIREAVAVTMLKWTEEADGLLTYVAVDHIKSTNSGYCFLQAGFQHIGYTNSRKLGTLRKLVIPTDEIQGCIEEYQWRQKRNGLSSV